MTVINNTLCQICSSNCLTCLSSNFSLCTSCSNLLYLHSNLCISTCPNFTYPDSNKCLNCIYPCLLCSSSTSCISCHPQLILLNTQCLSCLSPCLTCSIFITNCTSCNSSSTHPILYNSQCVDTCPSGYYRNLNTCLKCNLPC